MTNEEQISILVFQEKLNFQKFNKIELFMRLKQQKFMMRQAYIKNLLFLKNRI